ncbi:sulfurtransferase [Candidatus Chlorohelix sp.]|uniref:sulfurtransferase n=1 Tax=Candidatus Chlorohelix sp. TaxID=3139201 RepID=UPI003027EC6B
MREEHLVNAGWLSARLNDPSLRIIDMRGYVLAVTAEDGTQEARYTGAREEYEASHIPGAVYLDWTKDIVDLNDPVPVQVAGAQQIAHVLSDAGIGDEHTIIVYDAHPAMQFATRMWWVLRYYGHHDVRVLDGGWNKWSKEGNPSNALLPHHKFAVFTPRLHPELRAEAEQVKDMLGKPGITLVDARDIGQYSGKIRRGTRGGHIPSAISLPREELIDSASGTFKSDAEIRAIAENAGLKPEDQIVAYCNGGVAATSVLFSLSIIGFHKLTNYDGSWNEWNEREDLPIE